MRRSIPATRQLAYATGLPSGGASHDACQLCAIHCGSGVARESGGSGNKDVEGAGLFASKPAPTGTVFDVPISALGRYPLQSPGLARILRRLSVSRHFLRFPQ
ncbi:hypothetical protein C1Y13_01135 [Pseudomonas sp. FW305-33]|nr:hypothetical protein C1Y13_01135 [Pseudomonas sp. FW305-33]